jgi:cytidylate kinase
MSASVIAISAQTGAGGYVVARQVAEKLGFKYYDWEITLEAAARAGVEPDQVIAAERVPGFIERMMNRLGANPAISAESGASLNEPTSATWSAALQNLDSESYRQFIEKIVLEIAQAGDAVIVGHAGQYTLRARPDVLRVLIQGSLERRSARFANDQGITPRDATATVKESDRQRTELLRRIYHFEWLDASMYELTLSTDRLELDFATDTIISAAHALR